MRSAPRPVLAHPGRGPHRGPVQRRVARADGHGGDPEAHGLDDGRPDARARRLRETLRGGPADLGHGVPVSAPPGHGLGGRGVGCRARGSDQRFNLLVGRDLQRDHGQEPQVALHDAAARRHRRCPEDEPIARQLRRHHGGPRRDVRQARARARRPDRRVPSADARLLRRPVRGRSRGGRPRERFARRVGGERRMARSSSSTTVPGPASAPRSGSTPCTATARCQRRSRRRRSRRARSATNTSGCRACSPRPASPARTRRHGASIEQGGVRLDGGRSSTRTSSSRRAICVAGSCRSAGAGSSACVDGGGVRTRAATMDAAEQRCLQLTVRRARSVDAPRSVLTIVGRRDPLLGSVPAGCRSHLEN